jgi:hypothetical protein
MYLEIVAPVTILNLISPLRGQHAAFSCIASAECFQRDAIVLPPRRRSQRMA